MFPSIRKPPYLWFRVRLLLSLRRLDTTKLEGHVEEEQEYKPFFAVLSVQPPHNQFVGPTHHPDRSRRIHPSEIALRPNVPHVASIRERAAFDLAGYYDMIENLDYNVGRIREALKRMDVDRETYVVFFSDHGEMAGSHGHAHLGLQQPTSC